MRVISAVAGEAWQEKVKTIRKKMQANQSTVLVITALDEVACECIDLSRV